MASNNWSIIIRKCEPIGLCRHFWRASTPQQASLSTALSSLMYDRIKQRVPCFEAKQFLTAFDPPISNAKGTFESAVVTTAHISQSLGPPVLGGDD